MFGFGELNNDFDYDGDFDFTKPVDRQPAGETNPDPHDSDPHDFWKHEPTRSMPRISSRRKPSTRARTSRTSRSALRARAARQRNANNNDTTKIPVFDADGVIILDDTACRPFDGATDTGGMSRTRPARTTQAFGGENNPLLRRVGAMMVLLSLGVPVAMAMRGDEGGRDSLSAGAATAIAAAEASATESVADSVAVSVDVQTAVSVETPLATVAADTGAAVVVTETAAPKQTQPAAQPVVQAAPACVKTYTVALGDGWLRIANAHSVTLDELLASNAANVSTFLLVGATICVPANATDPTTTVTVPTPAVTTPAAAVYVAPFSLPCAKTYVVVLGDGWLRIANKHGVEMKDLLAANAASSSTFLMVGKKICVPANATTPTTAPPTTVKVVTTTKTTHPAPTPTISPPNRTYTAAEVEAIIREIWPDDLEDEAVRIATRESHLNPRAQNYCCYGLFQIYFNVHKVWLAELGITSGEMLLDPYNAAKAGLRLYERNGWGPWKL